MGLFSRRGKATVTLSPTTPVRPTETITATVTLDEPLDKVTAASVELGYVNGFRYRWAGKADAALNRGNDSITLTLLGEPGTNYGSDKDTEEWVHVLSEPLVVAAGTLGAGTHQVALRVPSWAPGSSQEIVRWQARVRIERDGKDVEAEAPFTVLAPAPDPAPASADLPLIQGERALSDDLVFEIETERGCYRPGEEVRGTVAVTPRSEVTRKALLAVWFQRWQDSHPVSKNPGGPTESFIRPMVSIAKDVQLTQGERAEFSFALTLPGDVDPTVEAVNSSISWFLQIKVEFAGATGAIERARRGIVVYTG